MRAMIRLMAMGLACAACVSGEAVAADAAGVANVTNAPNTLGRLFFAPAQRVQLDTARAQRDRRGLATAEANQPDPRQGPDVVTYSGMVRRNDGKSTVWINGKPITERTRDGDVNVTSLRGDGTVSVAVPQAEHSASLRVGQSVDVVSGRIEEPYARRATIPRVPAKPDSAGPIVAAPLPVPTATAAQKPGQRATRSDAKEKESDPDSGAAPPIDRSAKPGK